MVDLVGIEPTTSSMPWKRAPKLRHRPTVLRGCNFSIFAGAPRFVNVPMSCWKNLALKIHVDSAGGWAVGKLTLHARADQRAIVPLETQA
jgi:hypothetical protein